MNKAKKWASIIAITIASLFIGGMIFMAFVFGVTAILNN